MPTEKQLLEKAAIREFSEALALLHDPKRLVFNELRNPPEPDGFCSLDGCPLHIEVGHVYGNESDAKRLLGRIGKAAPSKKQIQNAALTPLDDRLLVPLNRLLAKKATNDYCANRVWLLIRSAFPLWNVQDFMANKERISIPSEHPFEEIWLLCGPRASFGVMRLA